MLVLLKLPGDAGTVKVANRTQHYDVLALAKMFHIH